ncbi:hypothetical protein P3T73_17375 [Kiritimatiellota bacterium B12222]|nr:hypothetical protein P3T73_17375 [Kiritimatiellota bacterium B12222]
MMCRFCLCLLSWAAWFSFAEEPPAVAAFELISVKPDLISFAYLGRAPSTITLEVGKVTHMLRLDVKHGGRVSFQVQNTEKGVLLKESNQSAGPAQTYFELFKLLPRDELHIKNGNSITVGYAYAHDNVKYPIQLSLSAAEQ